MLLNPKEGPKVKLFLMLGLTLAVIGVGISPIYRILFPAKGDLTDLEASDSAELELNKLQEAIDHLEGRKEF